MRVKQYLTRSLRELIGLPVEKLLDGRYEKFRRMGVFLDDPAAVVKANGQLV
jgi:acetyl-CoA carboxylase carboxyl transferase subunit alpha